MKRIIISSVILLVFCLLVTGCNSDNEEVISNGKKVNTSKLKHKSCKGEGHIDNNSQANMFYEVYYKENVIYLLKSTQQIISSKTETLDLYEESFNNIKKNYEGLEYYDTEIKKNETSIEYIQTINYDKMDINKLLDIEGEKDNIIENGQAKLDKWLALSKQFGVKCEEAEDE